MMTRFSQHDEVIQWDALAEVERQEIFIQAMKLANRKFSIRDGLHVRASRWDELSSEEQDLLYRADWKTCLKSAHAPVKFLMKNFEVTINGQSIINVQATKARIAINRAMERFQESMFTPSATIMIRCRGTVKTEWRVRADVPCDSPGSYKRATLPIGPFKTQREADEVAQHLSVTQQAKYPKAVRMEVKS